MSWGVWLLFMVLTSSVEAFGRSILCPLRPLANNPVPFPLATTEHQSVCTNHLDKFPLHYVFIKCI